MNALRLASRAMLRSTFSIARLVCVCVCVCVRVRVRMCVHVRVCFFPSLYACACVLFRFHTCTDPFLSLCVPPSPSPISPSVRYYGAAAATPSVQELTQHIVSILSYNSNVGDKQVLPKLLVAAVGYLVVLHFWRPQVTPQAWLMLAPLCFSPFAHLLLALGCG